MAKLDLTTPVFDPSRPPRIILLGAGDRPQVAAEIERLRPIVERHAEVVAVDLSFALDLSSIDADLVVVLGGDGSILRAAYQMGHTQKPALGVNLGKLGFLADLTPDEFVQQLPDIAAGKFRLVDHLMFECRLFRDGVAVVDELGLNEIAVLAGPPFAILEVELYVDSELATTYSCDGLLVSTPIGSTAHNLSAGGPILRNDLDAFVISPISPHTLTNRPVVESADRVIELVVPRPHEGSALVVDGRLLGHITADDRIRAERSSSRFQLIQVPGHGYYQTLREKLRWGGSIGS